jgi:hypothetical protein
MTRVVSVGRSKRLFAFAGTGLALLVVSLTGCPGSLNPNDFPPPSAGTAGSGTTTGAAGTGTAGVSGAAGMGCATINDLWTAKACTTQGACHDAMGSAAGFNMTTAGWDTAANLVGKLPPGGGVGALASVCMGKGMPYITKAQPAGGLILNKLSNKTPACGAQMPNIGVAMTATELACVQAWANQLAAMAP